MMKRSDFAQKLLDDLRVRKERMAASQSSKSSKPIAGDAYSYTKRAYRGFREMKTPQTSGFKNGTTCHKPTGGNKSLAIGEASKDIAPFGRGRSSEQIGDLSMALAFALETGGKLIRTDSSGNSSMLGFLNQIGRTSVDMGKMERIIVNRHSPASPFPTISQLHIEEISRGAQKLNQILRACSNGLNFDRYSIEIGKELLKGAMDLEDSLRMLVNLQEASEYIIAPQSKTRITFLDEKEDDDSTVKTATNNQLVRPIFSFDKPSRNTNYIQEAAKADLKQRLMALTYQSETKNFSHDTHALNSTFHRRSISYGPNVKTLAAFAEQKNYSSPSKSKPEKGRIPNVIAKLMGLEELPENVDSNYITKKESSSKEKVERKVTKKTADGNTALEQKTKDAANLVSQIRKHKQIQPNQIQVERDLTYGKQAERNLASHHASFEEIVHDGKPPQKDVQGIKQMRSSIKAKMKIDKHQSHTDQSSQSIGSRKDIQEKDKRQENKKLRDQNGKEKGETKELILKHQLQQVILQTQNGSEAGSLVQEPAECNLTMLKTERRDTHKLPFNNQPSSPNDLAFQQSHMLQNSESQDTKRQAGESEQQTVKQKIQVIKQTGSEFRSSPKAIYESPNFPKKNSYTSQETPINGSSTTFHTMQSVGFPNKRHHGDLVQDKNSDFIVNMQDSVNMNVSTNSNQNSPERNLHFKVIKEKNRTIIPPDMEEKPVHLPAVQKVKVTKAQKAEAPRKIDELVTRRIGNPHSLARPPKQQISTLQKVKQKRRNKLIHPKEEEQVRSSRLEEAERCIVKSKKLLSSKQQSNVTEQLQSRADQASNLCCPLNDECKSLKGPVIRAPNENLSTVINVQQGQEPDFSVDKLRSHSIVIESLNRTHEGRIDITDTLQLENEKVCVLERVKPLTESENHLKQILIKSQLFLNTAEALFKLNIPLDILDVSGYNCYDEEGKLILDCGYEVMKRKGKRQELCVHPFMRNSITSMKVRSLDNLVKQLHKDLKRLRFYNRNDIVECVLEDYLPKMLEIDVYNRDPDLHCMWDFGWHEMMFAFLEKDDVIRDVGKHVLNSLLDEVTRDLMLVF